MNNALILIVIKYLIEISHVEDVALLYVQNAIHFILTRNMNAFVLFHALREIMLDLLDMLLVGMTQRKKSSN